MKTEEQKNKLFIPRNINKRYSDWNKDQPDIMINGHSYRFNQYDLDGNKIGLWLDHPESIIVNYNNTKEFLSNIFNKLELRGDDYLRQDLKNEYIWVSYSKIWSILEDRYSLERGQVHDLIKVWMEEAYKLGSLTPLPLFVVGMHQMEEAYKLGSLTPFRLKW